MSLIEAVERWDEATIHAIASSHRAADNALRRNGELPIAAGIEYGAQAAAAHGALVSGRPSADGFLASVRAVRFHVRRLDDVPGALEIYAEQLGAADQGVLYGFRVQGAGRALVEGRLAVAFPR
jgi:predicted hotdog family 3-hydroxylacyl-ACP dehydratase